MRIPPGVTFRVREYQELARVNENFAAIVNRASTTIASASQLVRDGALPSAVTHAQDAVELLKGAVGAVDGRRLAPTDSISDAKRSTMNITNALAMLERGVVGATGMLDAAARHASNAAERATGEALGYRMAADETMAPYL